MRLVQQHQLQPASVAGFVEACALALQEYAAQHGQAVASLAASQPGPPPGSIKLVLHLHYPEGAKQGLTAALLAAAGYSVCERTTAGGGPTGADGAGHAQGSQGQQQLAGQAAPAPPPYPAAATPPQRTTAGGGPAGADGAGHAQGSEGQQQLAGQAAPAPPPYPAAATPPQRTTAGGGPAGADGAGHAQGSQGQQQLAGQAAPAPPPYPAAATPPQRTTAGGGPAGADGAGHAQGSQGQQQLAGQAAPAPPPYPAAATPPQRTTAGGGPAGADGAGHAQGSQGQQQLAGQAVPAPPPYPAAATPPQRTTAGGGPTGADGAGHAQGSQGQQQLAGQAAPAPPPYPAAATPPQRTTAGGGPAGADGAGHAQGSEGQQQLAGQAAPAPPPYPAAATPPQRTTAGGGPAGADGAGHAQGSQGQQQLAGQAAPAPPPYPAAATPPQRTTAGGGPAGADGAGHAQGSQGQQQLAGQAAPAPPPYPAAATPPQRTTAGGGPAGADGAGHAQGSQGQQQLAGQAVPAPPPYPAAATPPQRTTAGGGPAGADGAGHAQGSQGQQQLAGQAAPAPPPYPAAATPPQRTTAGGGPAGADGAGHAQGSQGQQQLAGQAAPAPPPYPAAATPPQRTTAGGGPAGADGAGHAQGSQGQQQLAGQAVSTPSSISPVVISHPRSRPPRFDPSWGPLPSAKARVAAFFEAVTLNVQGLTHPHKFQAILDWAADSPAQVFFLQECHRAECVWKWAESATGAKPCWRGLWFYTPGTGHSQGCLALFKPSTILVGCSQVHLQVAGAQGRVLRVDAELAGRPASLVCVYAPAQASQRAAFFNTCLPACLPLASERRLVIMGGDFNCILSPEDKVGTPRGGSTAHPVGWLGSRGQGAQQLQELVAERGLVDAWRHLRPGTRDFTHFSTAWQTGGRLDRWYIPAELVEWQLDSSILGLKPVHTDHAAVSLAVCPPNLPITAPAPWQLHPAYLDDPDMMDRLRSFLQREAASHAAQMSSLPSPLPRDLHRARWAHIKQGLALHAQRFIRDRRRAQRALQRARERAAHGARTHLVQQLLEVEQLGEAALQAAVVVGEATALVGVTDRAEAAQRSLQASAVLDQVYGDSSSFYFYHRHQSAHTPTLITSLHLPNLPDQVADLTTPHGVQAACHAFQSHFSAASPLGVYAAKPVVPAARATLLASLTSRLTPTQADSSEGPGGDPMLSEEELGRALQGCAHSKAPGKDGLPMEVYDRLWPLLRPPLMAMLREALADTSSPAPLAEFLTGLVTLVPKAGKPRDQVTGYRPITLLNCDVRLVARALEDRLQRPLDLLVSPSQSAFILGRDIGDNVQFHLSLLEYLRQRGSPAWLLLLDLAGAYDNVSWDLLQATMEAMGFRQDGHVRWAQILHRGATSQVLVNGHLTNSFPLESGLLQGSGASPLYWCIVLQPLVSYLSSLQLAGQLNTPSIPVSPLASHMATLQPTLPSKEYADDITITVLDRVKDGAVVVEALEVFRAAGGPALSLGKSQALPCAQQELQQGQQGWAGGGAGAHERGPGEAGGRLELGAGGGEPRGGEELGRRERQQQARGPKPLSESQGPSTGIPATREGVPVRHLGVPLGAVCDGVSSEAAFGGSAGAMTAASLSWTPQGLNLLGRVQVAQQCLASKPIYQMAFIKPSAAHGKAMAKAVKRFVAMSDLPQERCPNMSRLYPREDICAMPRREGGLGYPDLAVTSTAMLAKMLAQLWSPRVRPWQPLVHSLLADPLHSLSTWVITKPSASPSRSTSPRLQAHIAAMAELFPHRIVDPAAQQFHSVLAEPLWFNAQVRLQPGAELGRDPLAAEAKRWTHIRHVWEALHRHSSAFSSAAHHAAVRWEADYVRATLPEAWQRVVDTQQPPPPEWECVRASRGFLVRRSPSQQPTHWVAPSGRLEPFVEGEGPLGAVQPEPGACWVPAAVVLLDKPSYRLTVAERARHLRPLPFAQAGADPLAPQGLEQGRGRVRGNGRGRERGRGVGGEERGGREEEGTPSSRWPKEEWLLGPWDQVLLDPQVWGLGTTSILQFSVKRARARLLQLKQASSDPRYPPRGGLWPLLWGPRPLQEAGAASERAVGGDGLRVLEQRWQESAAHAAERQAQRDRELEGRDVGSWLVQERLGSPPPRWQAWRASPRQRPTPVDRAAVQAQRQLEAQRQPRQAGRRTRNRDVEGDPLTPGRQDQSGQPCLEVWQELLDPTLRREHVVVAWRILHGSLMVGAMWGHVLGEAAGPSSFTCRLCQAGPLETLSHAFLTCPYVAPAWEWVLDVYGSLTGTRPPSGDALLLLTGRPTRGEAPSFTPPDPLLWRRLRVAYLGTVWRLRTIGPASALQPEAIARRVVQEVILTLSAAVKRDWFRGKADKAKPAPQPGRWLDRDCNAALNMQRIGKSRWRPLELCYWPEQGTLPAKGKEYPGLGYKRMRDKSPEPRQQQQQSAAAQ
ncbi:hypothetical protein QJQ45_010168 [Haematococcus lacustris]|nr:hypothetical protein QJQ45_010168 [Haematococcus lacustris]